LIVFRNPAVENQAIDRVYRLGQQKNVQVHRIVIQGSIEDRILELQDNKQKLADGVLGDGDGEVGDQRGGRLSIGDLMRLFRD
jgi:SNF2 family DNA or RNA helicase